MESEENIENNTEKENLKIEKIDNELNGVCELSFVAIKDLEIKMKELEEKWQILNKQRIKLHKLNQFIKYGKTVYTHREKNPFKNLEITEVKRKRGRRKKTYDIEDNDQNIEEQQQLD